MAINPSEHKPDRPQSAPQARSDTPAQTEWLNKARNLHRNKRLIGFTGAVLGAGFVLWWRYSPAAPTWAEPLGFAIVGVSMALIVYTIADRWMWVKRNPPPR